MANEEHLALLLSGVDFWNAWRVAHPEIRPDLTDAVLTNADLRAARLRAADLSGATFSGANLTAADLSGANLVAADLTDARLGYTTLTALDLSQVRGLEAARHLAPSSIGIDTISLTRGQIPEAFLRGAGVPDSFIEYMRSLVSKPIDFYSCFISYSSKDQPFAERLYADLQSKGVRCWFAPEDMKIGDEIRPRIDESIRLHDKLLLILSAHSVASTWVKKEVETAFEREHREKKPVLFPVRLDETVLQTDVAWAADLRRMRHIGDFTRWKAHDQYQQALIRLLHDLKAESS